VLRKDLNKAFGVVLRSRMKAAGMTQEKLSQEADVDVKNDWPY
jgi:hypothetical protein